MTDHNIDPNQLADLLDDLLPPGVDTIPDDIEAADGLAQIAAALASQPRPAPSFEAMARMQSRMLNAQQQAATPSRSGRRILRLVQPMMTAVASVILVMFFASPLIAQSKPGDFLYSAKLAYERVELGVAGATGNEAQAHLSIAENRAREALSLTQSGEFNAELVEKVAQEISNAANVVQQTGAPPPLELTADLTQINTLVDFAIAEAESRDLDAGGIARAVAAMDGVRGNGDMLALGLVEEPESPEADEADEARVVTTTGDETDSEEDVTLVEDEEPVIMSIVGDGRVNVRSGPGMDFEVIVTLRPGSLVQVIDASDDGEWRLIRLPDGTEGWVADFLLGSSENAGGLAASGADTGDDGQRDFGCGQRGNSCNAPGQQKNNPNPNGQGR